MPNFTGIGQPKKTFCGWMDARTYGCVMYVGTYVHTDNNRLASFGQLIQEVGQIIIIMTDAE